jgi:hypothetical protein
VEGVALGLADVLARQAKALAELEQRRWPAAPQAGAQALDSAHPVAARHPAARVRPPGRRAMQAGGRVALAALMIARFIAWRTQ